MSWFRVTPAVVAAVVACLGGCAPEPIEDRGVLVIPFELGNRKECESLGVVTVRAELDEGHIAREIDCEAGQIRFDSLVTGRYDAVLYGLDDDDNEVMDSLAEGPVPLEVVGRGATVVADPAVKLTAAPARLRLRWDLGFGNCASTAIDRFEVTAWHYDGSELLVEADVACETAGEGAGQYRAVPDVERALSGDELGEVTVLPVDRSGVAVGDPAEFSFAAPGPGRYVELSLFCDAGGCTGSGKPD